MKTLFLLATMLFSVFTLTVTAQSEQTANEGFVGYSFLRQDVEFSRAGISNQTIRFDENTDSHGFNASYTRYVGGDNKKVGVVGFTGDVGANFDNNEASLVTVMAGVTAKARNNEYLQPYVRAMGGVARQNVNRFNFNDNTDVSGAFLLGTGLDINLKKDSRYKVRFGADYLNTGFASERQNGVRFTTGFVF